MATGVIGDLGDLAPRLVMGEPKTEIEPATLPLPLPMVEPPVRERTRTRDSVEMRLVPVLWRFLPSAASAKSGL